jgi:hypothetical protein
MKNTIIRGILAVLLVFGLVLTGCPIAGGGAGPGEILTEVPDAKIITLSGIGDDGDSVRIVATLRQEPSLRPRALTAEVGIYDYEMYLMEVLIQKGVLEVKADPVAPATAQIFEFAPFTTAKPAGDSDKGFTLKVTESGAAKTDDSKSIVVTEMQQPNGGPSTVDALIAAGVLEAGDDAEDMQSAVEEIVEEAMEEATPAPTTPTATIQPALKALLQGTWVLQNPDAHKNTDLQAVTVSGQGNYLVCRIPERGTTVTFTGNNFAGSQKVDIEVYSDEELISLIETETDRPPYEETGTVVFTTAGGEHTVTMTRVIPAGHELQVGETEVTLRVVFSNDNKTINLIGYDAEDLYFEGSTWIKG